MHGRMQTHKCVRYILEIKIDSQKRLSWPKTKQVIQDNHSTSQSAENLSLRLRNDGFSRRLASATLMERKKVVAQLSDETKLHLTYAQPRQSSSSPGGRESDQQCVPILRVLWYLSTSPQGRMRHNANFYVGNSEAVSSGINLTNSLHTGRVAVYILRRDSTLWHSLDRVPLRPEGGRSTSRASIF